jgi:tetratricopeptide (TPR) repeat protein
MLRELADFSTLLQGAVLDDVAQITPREPPVERLSEILNTSRRRQMERDGAKDTFEQLLKLKREDWQMYLDHAPTKRTEALAECIIAAAVGELDRDAKGALALLDEAETILPWLDPRAVNHLGADIEKNRANAHRELGSYPEALAAAERVIAIASDWAGGGFDIALGIYARGTTFFKMGQYKEALKDAIDAGYRFAEFGAIQRVIYARNLEASVHTEEGAVAEALHVYRLILPQAERIGDVVMAARATSNIAVAQFRLGELSEAESFALDAKRRFTELGIESEVIRSEWVLAAITFSKGAHEEGLTGQYRAARAFEQHNMLADVAFVKLHMVGDLLSIDVWDEAERLAREAADTFAQSGAKLHQMQAIAYLREAVEKRSATRELVDYVRAYIAADNPLRAFTPPIENSAN